MTPTALIEQQRALQAEAGELLHTTGIPALLARAGRPVYVGSYALGLMVWRDIDITVVCQRLEKAAVLQIAGKLAAQDSTASLTFRSELGRLNPAPADYPDGCYLGLGCQPQALPRWNLDIWFVDEPHRQPDLRHLETLAPRLNEVNRLAILTIKAAWAHRPEYRRSVTSADIYTAVLDGGVDSPAAFDAWLATTKQ